MKRLMGFCLISFALGACSGAGDRKDNTTDITTQRAPSSDPNGFQNQTLDTSTGHVADSSTVVSYDTSAKAKHN